MSLKSIANEKIVPAAFNDVLSFSDGDTADIISTVLSMHKKYSGEVKDFAPYLKGNSLVQTCGNIWHFIKANIKYKKDPDGVQWVKSPARTWADKVCDCKSYSVFIASILTCLKIPCKFRFVSFEKNNPLPTHVYIVVMDGRQEIIIDDVITRFNYEVPYTHKKDCMTQIVSMNGLPTKSNAQIGRKYPRGFGDTLGNGNDSSETINGGVATLFSGTDRKAKLTESLPQLSLLALYLFIPSGRPGSDYKEWQGVLGNDKNYLAVLPGIITSKRNIAMGNFFDFTSWAGYNESTGNAAFLQSIRAELTKRLGQDPTAWWIKQLSTAGIGAFDFSSLPGGIVNNATGSGGGLLSTAAGLATAVVPYANFIAPALGFIGKLFGGTDWQWKRGAPETFIPSHSDWASFKTNPIANLDIDAAGAMILRSSGPIQTGVPVFDTAINQVYVPAGTGTGTPGLTLVGTGSNPWNMIYKDAYGTLVNSSGQPVDANGNVLVPGQQPVNIDPAKNTTTTASMNIWLTVGLGAAVLGAMFLSKKKK